MILLTIWMIRRLSVRRAGRAWEAIRQDEDVAELMGVHTLKYKLWSFSLEPQSVEQQVFSTPQRPFSSHLRCLRSMFQFHLGLCGFCEWEISGV